MRKKRKHAHKWAWPNHPVRPTGKFKWKLSFCRSPDQEVTDAPLACNNGAGVPNWSDVMARVFYFIFFKSEPKQSWTKIKKSEISSAPAFLSDRPLSKSVRFGTMRAQRAAEKKIVGNWKHESDEERDGANRLVAPGDFGLISHLKLMEEEVKMRIIDTQLPLTCLPIKLISFCQFIS